VIEESLVAPFINNKGVGSDVIQLSNGNKTKTKDRKGRNTKIIDSILVLSKQLQITLMTAAPTE
jgi:hypothetical protein